MNKTIMKKYYEMQGKVILPEQKDNDNLSLAATVAANFISIGFPLTTEQLRALAKADAEDIKDFYEDNFAMRPGYLWFIRTAAGAKRIYERKEVLSIHRAAYEKSSYDWKPRRP